MENMENYLFEYWKINPQIRKIKNEDLGITLLKIDDEAWVDKDGHIQIRESWNNLTMLSEIIKLREKYVMYVGKHNNWNQNGSNLETCLRIIVGKLENKNPIHSQGMYGLFFYIKQKNELDILPRLKFVGFLTRLS